MVDNEELARQAACKAMNFILGGMTKDSDDISYTLGRLDSDLCWIAQNEHNHIIRMSIRIYSYMMMQFCDELKAEMSNKQEIKNDEKAIGIARFTLADSLLNSKSFISVFPACNVPYGVALPLGAYEELDTITRNVIAAYKEHI